MGRKYKVCIAHIILNIRIAIVFTNDITLKVCAREDSNLQPSEPESDILSIELRAQQYLVNIPAKMHRINFFLKFILFSLP